MAATTIGGLLRGLMLGTGHFGDARVFRDNAPTNPTYPCGSINDHLTTIPGLKGDGRTMMLDRMSQVDVWEKGDDEDPQIRRDVYEAIDGARITLPDLTIMRCSITDSQRLVEQDTNIVHTAFTVAVSHDPRAL